MENGIFINLDEAEEMLKDFKKLDALGRMIRTVGELENDGFLGSCGEGLGMLIAESVDTPLHYLEAALATYNQSNTAMSKPG